jgi:hypothetical protein
VNFLVENSSRANYWKEKERKSARKEHSNGAKSTPTEGLAPNTCNNLEINWKQQEFRPKTTHKTLYSCQIRGMAPSQRKAMNCYNDLQRIENPELELREK